MARRYRPNAHQLLQAKVIAVPGRELYGKYHRLIDELAQSAGPETDWRAQLKAHFDSFEADAATLDSESARLLREELCVQFEHEALHSTRPITREILFVAVNRLEADD